MGDSRFRYFPGMTPGSADAKMAMYAKNMLDFAMAFDTFGTQRFKGHHDATLRRMAADSLVEIREYLGTDRLVISDHYAIVPNYYARLENKSDDPDIREGDEEVFRQGDAKLILDPSGPTHLVYTVGFELVLRDFRNFMAMMDTMEISDSQMHVMHSALREMEPIQPKLNATAFDVPVGMVSKAKFDPSARHLAMTVIGQNGERNRYVLGTLVSVATLDAMIDQLIIDEKSRAPGTPIDRTLIGLSKAVNGK